MLGQMALTQPGHTSLGAESGPAYGAASIAATDTEALTRSIRAQLTHAGFNVPRLNLFPARESAADGWMAPGAPATITGFNRHSHFYLTVDGDLNRGAFQSQSPCIADAFERQDPRVDLVQIALHEVAHYAAYRLHLDDAVFNAVDAKAAGWNQAAERSRPAVVVDRFNVRERIADAGSILYLLSNYRDRAEIDDEAQARADVLRARVFDPDHDTSSSILAARAAFDAAPRHGLTIVAATQWAVQIVERQPSADLDVDGVLSEAGYRQAMKSRNRFCGVTAGA
jgi:hypothetical protein